MRGIQLVLLAVLGACDQPMTFTLGTFPGEPFDRPPHQPAPVVYINGIAGPRFEIEYPSAQDAVGDTHILELRHGDQVLRSFEITLREESCLGRVDNADRHGETYCLYESGDLRFSSDYAGGRTGTCIGDGFCIPDCSPHGGCTGSMHCTSRVTSIEPFASHLGCAPVGSKLPGEACSLIADPEGGAYDDCTRDHLCVEGTCRRVCVPDGSSCESCDYVPGHAPELRVCADAA